MDISTVISGDYQGREIKAAWGGGVYINAKGGEKIMIDSSTVKSYEVLEIDDQKSFSSGVARGLVGGAVFGGVGALAGINSAKTMKNAKIKILFKDGKCSLLKVNKIHYDAIINILFNLDSEENNTPLQTNQSSASNSYCTNCGNPITGEGKFCSSCGASILPISSNNSTDTQAEHTKTEELISDPKPETKIVKDIPSEELKKAKEDLSNVMTTAKKNYTKKTYTPKQVKKIFLIAVAIAAVLSLIMVIAMHTPGEGIGTDVFMFIFCTVILSIPTLLGALILCLPSIKKKSKDK